MPQDAGRATAETTYPGFPTPKFRETVHLHPGAAVWLTIGDGDLISVSASTPGLLWLAAFRPQGDEAGLDVTLVGKPVTSGSRPWFDSRKIAARLRVRGLEVADIVWRQVSLDGSSGRAIQMRFDGDCALIAAQPVESLAVVDGSSGAHLTIELQRNAAQTIRLPDPLGDTRDEFRVPMGTAQAYRVQAGEYIQIIDVQGQQCSDFMAFNARSLDRGHERHVDGTATRSMVRHAYPTPGGLFDKFFDQDLQPLLALVQDTVGRHDTFGLACTARGYEERGFFGHLNCSDNISNACAPYGIGRRTAWPAINFFWNTWIQRGDNRLASDEGMVPARRLRPHEGLDRSRLRLHRVSR